MKKTVKVVIEKEYEISISDALLTPEAIEQFESYMFELYGYSLECKQDSLFEYAAQQIAEYEVDFVEGLGHTCSVRTAPFHERGGKIISVIWDDKYYDIETEIVV